MWKEEEGEDAASQPALQWDNRVDTSMTHIQLIAQLRLPIVMTLTRALEFVSLVLA